MPSSRFDTSQEQQYVHNYIPLPFETIAALGEKANKNFAEGKQAEAELGALGQAIKAAPMYRDDRKAFIDNYNLKLKTLVDEAKGDYGSKDFQAKANALITEFKNDPKIQAFAETKEAFDNWQKAKLTGNAKDLDYTYDMDPNNPTGTNFRQRDVLKEGVYNNKITKWSDWGTDADKAVGQVAASGNQSIGNLNLGNTKIEGGTLYERRGNSWVGVTKDKLEGVVAATVPVYAASEGGQNHLETILQKEFGFGQNAYNVRYMDIDNAAKQAARKINAGQGTKEDQQAVDMKKQIDQELYNFMYSSNKHQEGVVAHKTVQDQIINDPKPTKGTGGDAENGPAIPLNQVVANPNPIPGLVNSEFKKTNPNSVFSFNDNGVMNHVKMGDVGSVNKITYTDKSGKIWDPERPPANWQYVVKPRTVTTAHLTDEERGVFVSNGGYEFRPSDHNYTRNVKNVPNTEIFNKQLNEVLSWGALTGQLDKSKKGIDQYNDLLPKYEIAIKNEVLNSKYLPAATKDLQDAFANFYFPKGTEDAEGKVKITEVGATANWLVDGKQVAPEELVGATFNGFASSNNPDDVLITTRDGKHHIANMNDPTLKDNLRRLTSFQKENHNTIMNPVANNKTREQQGEEVMSALDELGNIAIKNASDQGILSQELINHLQQYTTQMNAKIMDNAVDLEQSGYKYSSTYTDPKTNVVGVSYVNRKTGDTQVISYDSKNDMIQKMPADIFVKNITQKTLGNWNANINNNSKESGVNFENQKPN